MIKKLLVTLVGLFATMPVFAAQADLNWTHPTLYTDGTTIPAGTLTQSSILYGLCNATQTGLLASPTPVTVVVPYPTNTKSITGLGNGTWCFAVRSETATAQSDFTSFVSKTIVLKPSPPSGLTVSVTTAFMALRQTDRLVMIPVGTVPGSTVCDPNNGVIAAGVSYFAVPTSQVTWSGTTRPEAVFAKCA